SMAKPIAQTNPGMATRHPREKFTILLALISIAGFVGIISTSIFNYDLNGYIESFWIFLIGWGIFSHTKFSALKSLRYGITQYNFPNLITELIGLLAILSAILTFPSVGITHNAIITMKGMMAIIAILIIFVQTWVVKKN
ncbi:MAG: hypothetical protein KKE23_04415, partial [Nanoarchaeota archaeon]|nr:hypothetical protein [Nanoarchaeota archaeon]